MSLVQFHEVSFPFALAVAASGGPERRVEIVELASGAETRNAVWAGSRRRWDVGSAVTRIETLQQVIAFFEARGGRLNGFRFRDPFDHRSGPPGAAISETDQTIARGDGVTKRFQLTKTYGTFQRRILKPVGATVVVAVDGAAANFSINPVIGEIEFANAPANDAQITAGFAFDCPARFDTDRLEVSLEAFGAGRIVSIPLIEITG
jgi:uncharacterized protein (TIGR02217 family)